MPEEPSGVLMMLTGIAMIGVYMWRNGLIQKRLGWDKPKPAAYEYCEYERRFSFSFSNLSSEQSKFTLSH